MNKITRSAVAAVVVFLVAVALLGCQTQQVAPTGPPPGQGTSAPATQVPAAAQPTQAAQPAAQATAAPETLKLGIAYGITGPFARGSLISERSIRMAIDDANAKGGVKVGGKTYRIEAVTADDKATSEGGREAANRLVLAEKVRFILGPGSTSPVPGSQVITEPNKVLIFPASAPDPSLGPKFPFTLSVGSPNTQQRITPVYDWLVKERPQAKRVVVVGSDDVSGRSPVPIVEALTKERGLTLVATEFYPANTTDFNPLITRVLAQKPDVVDIESGGAAQTRFAGMAKALYEQGFKGTFIGSYGYVWAAQVGPGAEGYVFPVLVDWKSPMVPQQAKDVAQRYIQKYGESEFETTVMFTYSSPGILFQAMEKAGTVDDTEKIANLLRAGEWDTLYGKLRFGGAKTFGASAQLELPVFLSKVEGGRVVTFDVKPGTLP